MINQIPALRLEMHRLCEELGGDWTMSEGRADGYGLRDAEFLEVVNTEKCASIRLWFFGSEIRIGALIAGIGEVGDELTSLTTEEVSDIVARFCRSDYAIEPYSIRMDLSRRPTKTRLLRRRQIKIKLLRWPDAEFDCANPWGSDLLDP